MTENDLLNSQINALVQQSQSLNKQLSLVEQANQGALYPLSKSTNITQVVIWGEHWDHEWGSFVFLHHYETFVFLHHYRNQSTLTISGLLELSGCPVSRHTNGGHFKKPAFGNDELTTTHLN